MMDKELLIQVSNVSKKFSKNFKKSLWYGVKDVFSGITGNERQLKLRKDEFWAVKGISFELRRGQCLGLIGHNGAGKSTLLKMLNGLILPDDGEIIMKGKVGAMIELGAGFNPVLTGRENIYNNGAVLGFSKEEIDGSLSSIIEFSEIGEFIDTPVQNYSSGMKVRLGFAIAAQMKPDILIIDEVLAVGDMGFVMKCFNAIDKILDDTAIIFVSHSMPLVSRICNYLIVMDHGCAIYQSDDVSKGIDIYYSKFEMIPSFVRSDIVEIKGVYLNGSKVDQNSGPILVHRLEDLTVRFNISLKALYDHPHVSIIFYDKELKGVAEYICEDHYKLKNNNELIDFEVVFPNINFSKGIYSITLVVRSERKNEILIRAQSVAFFQVISKLNVWTAFELSGKIKQLN